MTVDIDSGAGFCFGVVKAVEKAEKQLKESKILYCLGEIVHNQGETNRLEQDGLKTINRNEYAQLKNTTVLLRAHGEPPETYQYAKDHNITLIDGTCPIVTLLQKRIRKAWQDNPDSQIVLFGKKNHPELIGINGQINNEGIVITTFNDLYLLDCRKPAIIYSQTTMSKEDYKAICDGIQEKFTRINPSFSDYLTCNKSACGQVANRKPSLKTFAENHDTVLFVAGSNSSNGKMLYEWCKQHNTNTFLVHDPTEIKKDWFQNTDTVGISGATSTPKWQMQQAADIVQSIG